VLGIYSDTRTYSVSCLFEPIKYSWPSEICYTPKTDNASRHYLPYTCKLCNQHYKTIIKWCWRMQQWWSVWKVVIRRNWVNETSHIKVWFLDWDDHFPVGLGQSYTTFGMTERGVVIQRNMPACCCEVGIWCIVTCCRFDLTTSSFPQVEVICVVLPSRSSQHKPWGHQLLGEESVSWVPGTSPCSPLFWKMMRILHFPIWQVWCDFTQSLILLVWDLFQNFSRHIIDILIITISSPLYKV
jgi:hypothetical protein